MRTIKKSFIDELTTGVLKPITDYVKNPDNDAILCIRENYINIYYKAHSLLKITQTEDESVYTAEYDLNHARYTLGLTKAKIEISKTGVNIRGNGHIVYIDIKKETGLPEKFFDVVEMFKNYIIDYFDNTKAFDYIRAENREEQPKRKKVVLTEKIRQQEIYRLGMVFKNNGYVCYDRESAVEGEDIKRIFGSLIKIGQPDCLFAKVENGTVTKIIFVEIKSTVNACLTKQTKKGITSGIVKHDTDFEKMLNEKEIQKLLTEQLKHAFFVYNKLGINNYPDEIKISETIEFDKHYILTDEAYKFLSSKSTTDDCNSLKKLFSEGKVYIEL